MNQYCSVEIIPLTTVTVKAIDDLRQTLLECGPKSQVLNDYLKRGWELLEFVTHHSEKEDATAVAAIIGLPRNHPKNSETSPITKFQVTDDTGLATLFLNTEVPCTSSASNRSVANWRTRAANCFAYYGIRTVGEIKEAAAKGQLTWWKIKSNRNHGNGKSYKYMRQVFEEVGIIIPD